MRPSSGRFLLEMPRRCICHLRPIAVRPSILLALDMFIQIMIFWSFTLKTWHSAVHTEPCFERHSHSIFISRDRFDVDELHRELDHIICFGDNFQRQYPTNIVSQFRSKTVLQSTSNTICLCKDKISGSPSAQTYHLCYKTRLHCSLCRHM